MKTHVHRWRRGAVCVELNFLLQVLNYSYCVDCKEVLL